ncbi:MAG: hypothetical protein GY826_14600 [Fuerstiella sp.]|nr:hypothetical protein [Fuerstiella sp.]
MRRSVRNVADAMHWLRLIANFASDEDCYSYDEKRELKRLLPDWDWNDPDRNGELFTHISETIHLFVDLDCKDEHSDQIKACAESKSFVMLNYRPPRKILYQAVNIGAAAPSTVPIQELN